MNNYEDIINLSRPESKHPKMSILDRASQFAPFSALEGYESKVKEVARITDKKIDIDEGLKAKLNDKLNLIKENIKSNPTVIITHFIKDNKKNGGMYVDKEGIIRKIDDVNKEIILYDKTIIKLDNIINIKADIFNE